MILIDGQPIDQLPADERALLYGESLFETVLFAGQRAPLWRRHCQRLKLGCRQLGWPAPDTDRLLAHCHRLIGEEDCDSQNDDRPVVIRIALTGGSGGQGYFPPPTRRCRQVLIRRPWPPTIIEQRRHGLRLATSPVPLATGSAFAGLKHGNRLEQTMAAALCRQAGLDEAVMLSADGFVVEAISANLVAVIDGRVVTPDTDACGVDGVGLGWLSDACDEPVDRVRLKPPALAGAEELVVVNSVAGVRPVVELDGRRMAIGRRCRDWQSLWQNSLRAP